MESVALMKAESYDEKLKAELVKLVELLGGFGSYARSGDRILLNPNFVMYNPLNSATTTDPQFIAAVTEILLDYGCRVTIGESPMIGTCKSVAKSLGLYERLEKYNVDFINFERSVPVDLKNDKVDGRKFKSLTLAGEIGDYDGIINLPKLKSHAQMGVTLATKNLFGCVVGSRKSLWHVRAGNIDDFARLMLEISGTVRPVLNIMDGIVGMDRNGPSHGRKRDTGVVLASTNPVALDRVVIELIQKNPDKIAFTRVARKLRLPGSSLEEIRIIGDSIESCKIDDFQLMYIFPVDFAGMHWIYGPLKSLLSQRIVIDHEKCIRCRRCEQICPARAMKFDEGAGKLRVDRSLCVKCCCCQESCPVGAISLHTPGLMKRFFK